MKRLTKDETISSLLDAVVECARQCGIDNIQATQVAAMAGVSVRTLHRYFPEKDELLSQASARYLDLSYKHYIDEFTALDRTELSGLEQLLLLMRNQESIFKGDVPSAILFVEMSIFRMRYECKKREWSVSGSKEIFVLTKAMIVAGMKDGSIRPDIVPERIISFIAASYNGLMQRLVFVYSSPAVPDSRKMEIIPTIEDFIKMLEMYLHKG